jgi:hypothetical protein
VQILASALPGFRDLRAPLTAGYMWLVFLWILVKPDIHKRPNSEVAAAVYDLAKEAGPIWIGLAVGVAAYLIGSVSQALSPMLGHKAFPAMVEWARGQFPGVAKRRLFDEWTPMLPYMMEAERKLGGVSNSVSDEVFDNAMLIQRRLRAEMDLPATLLLTERDREPDPQLFSEADRLKAEREMRLAVVPPLCAIVIFLGCNHSPWWWFALIPVAVLLWQAHSRNSAFLSLMSGALERGLARSAAIDEFIRWVESLPDESSEAAPTPSGAANRSEVTPG